MNSAANPLGAPQQLHCVGLPWALNNTAAERASRMFCVKTLTLTAIESNTLSCQCGRHLVGSVSAGLHCCSRAQCRWLEGSEVSEGRAFEPPQRHVLKFTGINSGTT